MRVVTWVVLTLAKAVLAFVVGFAGVLLFPFFKK
jgi:hypothetical protein